MKLVAIEAALQTFLVENGPVTPAADDPTAIPEEAPELANRSMEQQRLLLLQSHGVPAEVYIKSDEVDGEQLEHFCNSLAVRCCACANYVRRRPLGQIYDLQSLQERHDTGPYRSSLKLGVPFRVLNKSSVFLTDACALHLGLHRPCLEERVVDVVFNICLHRSWANDCVLHKAQVEAYTGLGGSVFPCGLYHAASFDPAKWLRAVLLRRGALGRSRSATYNPGSFGTGRGQSSLQKFAELLPQMLLAIVAICSCLLSFDGPSVCNSVEVLAWFQSGFGLGARLEWLGYQVCLDLSTISPTWFDALLVAVVGPGALDWLSRIFPLFPFLRGMCRQRVALQAAAAYQCYLPGLLATLLEGAYMRGVLDELGLPIPHCSDAEYWECELRQAEAARDYGGGGAARADYTVALERSILRGHELAGYSSC